ncbi:MAG: aminotransferase class V-fold PLP-dependent enzyme [Acidobacteriota bacterium]
MGPPDTPPIGSYAQPQPLEFLRREPNALAAHYSHFRVAQRLLLTGHSHQAWPDCVRQAQLQAFDDAAERVDEKWERAFAQASQVQEGFADLLDDVDSAGSPRGGLYALGTNTHELVLRFLSALPEDRRKLVTTTGEFHSIRRQLQRLEEQGVEIQWVETDPQGDGSGPESLARRLADAVDDNTAAVLVSCVLFRDSRIVPHLGELAPLCTERGVELLIDTYHALGAMPFSLRQQGLDSAFVVGGGYKYLQMGEGNCFLRVPPGRRLRPVITGWFAEFATLSEASKARPGVAYGQDADAFAGSTYDPTSHYRGAAARSFFRQQGLSPQQLRAISRHQISHLAKSFDELQLPPSLVDRPRSAPLDAYGAFLALRTQHAEALHRGLRQRGVLTDYRDDRLRFGPAPYLCNRQLEDAIAALGEAARELPV